MIKVDSGDCSATLRPYCEVRMAAIFRLPNQNIKYNSPLLTEIAGEEIGCQRARAARRVLEKHEEMQLLSDSLVGMCSQLATNCQTQSTSFDCFSNCRECYAMVHDSQHLGHDQSRCGKAPSNKKPRKTNKRLPHKVYRDTIVQKSNHFIALMSSG